MKGHADPPQPPPRKPLYSRKDSTAMPEALRHWRISKLWLYTLFSEAGKHAVHFGNSSIRLWTGSAGEHGSGAGTRTGLFRSMGTQNFPVTGVSHTGAEVPNANPTVCQLYLNKMVAGWGNANPPSGTLLLECDLLERPESLPKLGLHERISIFTRTVYFGAFNLQSPLNGTLPAQ